MLIIEILISLSMKKTYKNSELNNISAKIEHIIRTDKLIQTILVSHKIDNIKLTLICNYLIDQTIKD